ncbi:antiviral reverse transcriptase Drt3a [Gilliamella apicola]|uniref:antiviral reverse transcriptase Drt3a n=1 Tax=Gilliamella apicola TaxID=1196095 RepID=UPI0039876D47
MFDQSFSVKNFKKIYDLDKKNGGTIELEYFNDAYNISKKIQRLKQYINLLSKKNKNGQISKIELDNKKNKINEIIEKRKEQYNNNINEKLKIISQKVSKKGYTLSLNRTSTKIDDKDIYSIGNEAEELFVSKQIKLILCHLFNIKTNNRDLIISRLSALTKDKSPKFIIRADIKSFYESIDHKILLKTLHSSSKLSVLPLRVITQFIKQYKILTNSDKGLPRGVGMSAYLSELYMSVIDEKIKSLSDLTYYERFVDDLIIIFSPTKEENTRYYYRKIEKIIEESDLTFNDKTQKLDLFTKTKNEFEYLGYKFQLSSNNCKINMSQKKIEKIRSRINKSFEDYKKMVTKCPKKAAHNLLLRIKFLTGNSRLCNYKSNAFIGIYFSNRFINNSEDLESLDEYLLQQITSLHDQKLIRRMKKLSFKSGFEKKVFRKFTLGEFSKISKGWA